MLYFKSGRSPLPYTITKQIIIKGRAIFVFKFIIT